MTKRKKGENTLTFNTLGVTTTDPYNQFRDDGFVTNIEEHTKKIFLDNGRSIGDYLEQTRVSKKNNRENLRVDGKYIGVENDWSCLWIIFYKNNTDVELNIDTRAHEETHIIHETGKINLLEKRIKRLTGRDFSFGGLVNPRLCTRDEKEYVAAIGSCAMLYERGFDLTKGKNNNGNYSCKAAYDDFQRFLEGKEVMVER